MKTLYSQPGDTGLLSKAKRMISPLLGPLRKPLNALRGLRRKMARFIPSAGVHRKGSSNSTTTAFCAPLKKKRRWAPGRLVAETRGSRFSGCAGDSDARVAPCSDDRRHGVAAEPLEILRLRSTSCSNPHRGICEQ